ncbi:hypothetical protein SAMN04488003_1188 [Loktanella fryxellensis]|uniref:Uncharacterized protein n=1 Tax=Loktanella fryxellensis TaxID=245187 RepID=A0A1H8GWN4_9RHOB|nr:hypothetical protein [Loktanella fryxellensis]SEN47678.1 hypothetical protein SAMN04488003_1188 [Loktanella fryxellensis]
MTPDQARRLILFQIVNLAVTIMIRVGASATGDFIMILFGQKVIALLHWDDDPAQRDIFLLLFFVIGAAEVMLIFVLGSFSISAPACVSLFG